MTGLDALGKLGLAREACAGDCVVVPLRPQQLEHDLGTVRVARAMDDAGRSLAEPGPEPVVADLHRAIIPGAR